MEKEFVNQVIVFREWTDRGCKAHALCDSRYARSRWKSRCPGGCEDAFECPKLLEPRYGASRASHAAFHSHDSKATDRVDRSISIFTMEELLIDEQKPFSAWRGCVVSFVYPLANTRRHKCQVFTATSTRSPQDFSTLVVGKLLTSMLARSDKSAEHFRSPDCGSCCILLVSFAMPAVDAGDNDRLEDSHTTTAVSE